VNRFILIIISILISSNAWTQDQFKKKLYKNPVRELSIIVTDDGFFPSRIMAFQGERVKFFITSTSKKKQCFILQKHDVFLAVENGQVNEGSVLLDHAGRFKFYCPASEVKGFLTVFEKSNKDSEEGVRAPASTKPNYWLPRDYDEDF
jgi:hypothetical protein